MPSADGTNDSDGDTCAKVKAKSALCSVEEFVDQKYDYLVIGGGTAGLCVAARLTEDPNITVGVLEAGENRLDDKSILTPSLFATLPGRPEYDWMLNTIPQVCSYSTTVTFKHISNFNTR